tara:strand:+ start:937 stop:1044 length:108 start_codon:yes stop_codon:yes gene_type:complete
MRDFEYLGFLLIVVGGALVLAPYVVDFIVKKAGLE